MVKFSIITPSYNQSKFIKETIESVINQKGNFLIEYFIIDGGSTDGTVQILKKYGKKLEKHKRIKFIWKSEKDKGQSDAINKGLRIATGDILAYINSDDAYEPNAFKNVANFFNTHKEIEFVYGKCKIINEEGSEIRRIIKWYRHFLGRHYKYSKLLSENFIAQPATFWRRKVTETCGYFDVKNHLVMDYEYWLRIGQTYKGAFLKKNLAKFRWYTLSKSGASFIKQFELKLDVAKKYANGKHKLAIALHKLNRLKIIIAYSIMKKLGV
jgi:glycosyltransferase involved in cell wall biosynthesis